MSPQPTATRIATNYLEMLRGLLDNLDLEAVLRVGVRLRHVRDAGGTIYIAGNGGSAATSSHWANDLGKPRRRSNARPIRVVSLGDHLSWVSALANDEGYERVFAGQLENLARPGDLLVVISASGNSQNLIQAVRTARSLGASSVGFLGFDGGALKSLVDDHVWVPSPTGAYGPVEDMHHVICHVLATCLSAGAVETVETEPAVSSTVTPSEAPRP
jgi:D-sedoheptulose 7-phosphate isomerase